MQAERYFKIPEAWGSPNKRVGECLIFKTRMLTFWKVWALEEEGSERMVIFGGKGIALIRTLRPCHYRFKKNYL